MPQSLQATPATSKVQARCVSSVLLFSTKAYPWQYEARTALKYGVDDPKKEKKLERKQKKKEEKARKEAQKVSNSPCCPHSNSHRIVEGTKGQERPTRSCRPATRRGGRSIDSAYRAAGPDLHQLPARRCRRAGRQEARSFLNRIFRFLFLPFPFFLHMLNTMYDVIRSRSNEMYSTGVPLNMCLATTLS